MTDKHQKEEVTEPLLGRHREKKDPTLLLESSGSHKKGAHLDPHSSQPVRTYWWRWLVLAVFSLNLGMNNLQWISLGPVADVITCYYGLSNFWVNSLSMVYMLVYILLFVLSALSLDRLGLRTTIIIGSCMNALGAAMRLAGTGSLPSFPLPLCLPRLLYLPFLYLRSPLLLVASVRTVSIRDNQCPYLGRPLPPLLCLVPTLGAGHCHCNCRSHVPPGDPTNLTYQIGFLFRCFTYMYHQEAVHTPIIKSSDGINNYVKSLVKMG